MTHGSAQSAERDVAPAGCVLRAQGVSKRVRDGGRDVVLLRDIDLSLAKGERVALLGPSGSGKSSLLNVLGALDADFDGEVEVVGKRLRGMGDRELSALRNRSMGFIFQAYNLLGHLSALDNVLLPARFADEAPDRGRAQGALARVGLADYSHRLPAALSGGERQRVAIARALYHRPQLLLCDEPTGNLDRDTGAEVLRIFEEVSAEGVALLIATHDDAIAQGAHRVLRLCQGVLT